MSQDLCHGVGKQQSAQKKTKANWVTFLFRRNPRNQYLLRITSHMSLEHNYKSINILPDLFL